jgi:hypothetical protein
MIRLGKELSILKKENHGKKSHEGKTPSQG